MQIPKNIIQIGTADSDHKLYVEDYVHIFLKQNGKETADFYLYGRIERETDKTCYFIYGAAKQDAECNIVERRYFADLTRIGEATGDGEELWIFMEDGYSVTLENYFVFYEQNDGMQSYLIALHQNRPGEKDVASRLVRNEKNKNIQQEMPGSVTRTPRNEKEEKPAERNIAEKIGGKQFRTAIAAALLLLCVLGIRTMDQYADLKEIGNFFTDSDETEESFGESEKIEAEEYGERGFFVEEEQIPKPLLAETAESETLETQIEDSEEISTETEEIAEVISDAVITVEEPMVITENSYIVKKGDNLAAICRAKYGNTDRIHEVIDVNHLDNPNHLYPGQKIILPD